MELLCVACLFVSEWDGDKVVGVGADVDDVECYLYFECGGVAFVFGVEGVMEVKMRSLLEEKFLNECEIYEYE